MSNNPKIMIVGLGATGLSVARFLYARDSEFMVLDSRATPPQLERFKQEFPGVAIRLGEWSAHHFEGAQQIIVSPGVDINACKIREAAMAAHCECIGDIELFARNARQPVVAITGSNGKSTVTSLFAEMARHAGVRACAGGNLLPSALDLLMQEDAELFVLELSSFQLEVTQSLAPAVAVVLNVSHDHLDRHGDIERYAKIKEHVYANAIFSIINRDDEYVSKMRVSGKVISFGLGQPDGHHEAFGLIEEDGAVCLALGEQPLLPAHELALSGEAGVLNSLAALAIGQALELPMNGMLEVLKTFKGLPHRLALVAESQGVSWFNDSKGTNIGATISSLRSLEDNIILIAGGLFKGGDLELLAQVAGKHAKRAVLLGRDAGKIARALQAAIAVEHASSMQHAVEIAKREAHAGDKVLLSPACASFDMYADYIQRGQDFESCVRSVLS